MSLRSLFTTVARAAPLVASCASRGAWRGVAVRSATTPTAMASLASVGGMRHLNIHEYQSKMLMDKHGVKIQRWRLAESVDDVKKAVKDLGTVHSLVVSRTDARALSRSRSRVLTGSLAGSLAVTF